MVVNISRGKDTFHAGFDVIMSGDVAAWREIQYSIEEFRTRAMANSHEDSVGALGALYARLKVLEAHRIKNIAAQISRQGRIPEKVDLRVRACALLHDLAGTQGGAAMHNRHLGSMVRQGKGFLHRSVAATDHQNLLAAEKKPVTDRARGKPAIAIFHFVGQLQPVCRGAGGNDHTAGGVPIFAAAHAEGSLGNKVDLIDVLFQNLGAEALSLLLHAIHKLGSGNAGWKAREVFDFAGKHELSARELQVLGFRSDEQRRQTCSRRIDRRRESRRSRAYHNQLSHISPLPFHLFRRLPLPQTSWS